jgi:drug/metabolite transporter (DMT)-like permease
MLNAIAVVLCFIAMLLFFSKVLLYFKLKKPEKSIFWSLVTGQFIYYFAICLLPVFAATNFNQKTQRTLNILTYLFYFLIILGFLFGYFGYKLQEQ